MRLTLLLPLLVFVACGGSSSNPNNGPDGGGGGGGSGACANVACLQQVEDLMVGCIAGGSCVVQESTTAPVTVTQCFGNGVKIMGAVEQSQGSTDLTSTNTFTLKKSDALCYTRTLATHIPSAGGGITTDITTQDPSGATVATVHLDANNVATVTCPGGSPTVLMNSCGFATSTVNGAYLTQAPPPTCTGGACSF